LRIPKSKKIFVPSHAPFSLVKAVDFA